MLHLLPYFHASCCAQDNRVQDDRVQDDRVQGRRSRWRAGGLGWLALVWVGVGGWAMAQAASPCPPAVLERLQRHRIIPGETISSLAQQYQLKPETLLGLNPVLRTGGAIVGQEIVIPPHDGIRIAVAPGTTWQQLAQTYTVRADVLFEANGCVALPTVVFIPGVTWSPAVATSEVVSPRPVVAESRLFEVLTHYPLPQAAPVLTAYGWQSSPGTGTPRFQSGLRLQAAPQMPVLAAGAGTVAFAGQQAGYGNLVVINHALGLQTRYASLGTIAVTVGQVVNAGQTIGTLGRGADGGQASSLWFEVRRNLAAGWVAQDPMPYLTGTRHPEEHGGTVRPR
ncbi:peptidoglycan DD-metalloendopeptidase family protein [Trichothermofontia sp.]